MHLPIPDSGNDGVWLLVITGASSYSFCLYVLLFMDIVSVLLLFVPVYYWVCMLKWINDVADRANL